MVSDGSAVLGLGNIGGLAGLPVMEGKAVLFKAFGDVDAIPLVLNTQDPDEIIATVSGLLRLFEGLTWKILLLLTAFILKKSLKKDSISLFFMMISMGRLSSCLLDSSML